MNENITIARDLIKQVQDIDNFNLKTGLEYFILKCVDNKFELDILDTIVKELMNERGICKRIGEKK